MKFKVDMSLVHLLRQRELRNELWIVQENRIRIRSLLNGNRQTEG